MRILLTNDDGIHAEGLAVLERVARTLSDDVWIVAPETDQSGLAHSLTLSEPLRLRKVADKPLCVARHADRLRHHGDPRNPAGEAGTSCCPASMPAAMSPTTSPIRARLPARSRARCRASGPSRLSQLYEYFQWRPGHPLGSRRSPGAEAFGAADRDRSSAGYLPQHQLPALRAGRGQGCRGDLAGQARFRPRSRRAGRRPRLSLLLAALRRTAAARSVTATDLQALKEDKISVTTAQARHDRNYTVQDRIARALGFGAAD